MNEHRYVLEDKSFMHTILRTSNGGATWVYAAKYGNQIMWMSIEQNVIPQSARESPLLNLEEIIECLYASDDPQYREFIPMLIWRI